MDTQQQQNHNNIAIQENKIIATLIHRCCHLMGDHQIEATENDQNDGETGQQF